MTLSEWANLHRSELVAEPLDKSTMHAGCVDSAVHDGVRDVTISESGLYFTA